jgi:HEAT repeat protein
LHAGAAPARSALRTALQDSSGDVRILAAEILVRLGNEPDALPTLERALRDESVFIRFGALLAASRLGKAAAPLVPAIRGAVLRDPQHKDLSDYVGRMVEYLPKQIGE